MFRSVECGQLSQKKAVILPGQFHKVAAVPEEFETEATIERRRHLGVPHHDFGHQLFGRRHVPIHGFLERTSVCSQRWSPVQLRCKRSLRQPMERSEYQIEWLYSDESPKDPNLFAIH